MYVFVNSTEPAGNKFCLTGESFFGHWVTSELHRNQFVDLAVS